MRISFGLGAALLAGTTLLAANGVWAATETDNLSVSATITNECTLAVGTGGLKFGTIDTNGGTTIVDDSSVDLTLNCTTAAPASATIAIGGGENAVSGQRKMSDGGSNTLNYNLYSDPARTSAIAVDGTLTPTFAGTDKSSTVTIYGRVPPQDMTGKEGDYNDTVILTTTYEPGA